MIRKREFSSEQIYKAIELGEFPDEVTQSSDYVAIILTQDWCYQWGFMETWLKNLQMDMNLDIYTSFYNKEPYYEDFLDFKESVLGNTSIPYVRYYYQGKLKAQSNYVNQATFFTLLTQ
jgi:hypothetical protein